MSRKRPTTANRFRDARREAARRARHQSSGQLTFPGWFDAPPETSPGPRHPVAGACTGKRHA
jgi:hypothetical protein